MIYHTRLLAGHYNALRQSCGALLGIAQGLIADGYLSDGEVQFLQAWLQGNAEIATRWPGNVLAQRISAALADGVITEEERLHLQQTLLELIGGSVEDLASDGNVCRLPLDRGVPLSFAGMAFCLTGDFVFGPRKTCAAAIQRRGGGLLDAPTKKVHYVVVGGLGSREWKHGSFGTKIERAVALKSAGSQLYIVHEDEWAEALSRAPVLA